MNCDNSFPTLGKLYEEMEPEDPLFQAYCSGFDLAAEMAGETQSTYSDANLAWLWGHYTGRFA